MKILHVAPHLGGGVGKAHAAITGQLPKTIEQTFVLLEAPRDHRYADAIEATGARVVVADSLAQVARLAGAADIVQFEFWNHPRLFECLARCDFPAMRTVFWSHISGLFKPVIPPGLIEVAGRFVMTTEASLSIPAVAALCKTAPQKFSVINSGFGFAGMRPESAESGSIAYLGTVDFVKMHSDFFDVVDRLAGDGIEVCVWGAADPEVMACALRMRHPERIRFRGQTAEPTRALAGASIFFYPLQRDHYGTAENALVEAMSLGLVPVVLDNPAEMAIVRDGENGFVARSIDDCVSLLHMLLSSSGLRQKVSQNAISSIAQTRTPALSAQKFESLWRTLLNEPARRCEFQNTVGKTAADWFLATQRLPGETAQSVEETSPQRASKGTFAHFEMTFADDVALKKLRKLHK